MRQNNPYEKCKLCSSYQNHGSQNIPKSANSMETYQYSNSCFSVNTGSISSINVPVKTFLLLKADLVEFFSYSYQNLDSPKNQRIDIFLIYLELQFRRKSRTFSYCRLGFFHQGLNRKLCFSAAVFNSKINQFFHCRRLLIFRIVQLYY